MAIIFSNGFADNIGSKWYNDPLRITIARLSDAATEISKICARGALEENFGDDVGELNSDGDVQKSLDIRSDDLITKALFDSPVAFYASEEQEDILTLDIEAKLAVACDPLDGSSNINTNVSIGTIFSIYPSTENPETSFLRCGVEQIAAGFFVYGPQTTLVVTTGDGTELYTLDPEDCVFKLSIAEMSIAKSSTEFAINASNHRHWPAPISSFIDDCLRGGEGPLACDHNMRWIGSLVADANRILIRGGIFLYPDDERHGYGEGRLRLLYEANPVAFVVEQAGGIATDGGIRILGKTVRTLHQRVPLVFGSQEPVHLVAKYHHQKAVRNDAAPLFNKRGLFR
ncbi:MAG: class 1 fructose-bisphosphatase [Robiginitomaculum sp.]